MGTPFIRFHYACRQKIFILPLLFLFCFVRWHSRDMYLLQLVSVVCMQLLDVWEGEEDEAEDAEGTAGSQRALSTYSRLWALHGAWLQWWRSESYKHKIRVSVPRWKGTLKLSLFKTVVRQLPSKGQSTQKVFLYSKTAG